MYELGFFKLRKNRIVKSILKCHNWILHIIMTRNDDIVFCVWRLGSGKPSNVIVDGGRDSEEEEDETFMVEETAAPQEPEQVRAWGV